MTPVPNVQSTTDPIFVSVYFILFYFILVGVGCWNGTENRYNYVMPLAKNPSTFGLLL